MDSTLISIVLWPNGQKRDKSFNMNITKTALTSLKRLKEVICTQLQSPSVDKISLYKPNGIPFDDADLENIHQDSIVFFAENGAPFSTSNQYNIYTFVKQLKSGGYGKVFLAVSAINKQQYAVKQISTKKFTTEDLYLISRENLYLSSLSHKNIIKYYTSFSYDNSVYIVMDYAKGGELNKYVSRKGPLSEKEAKMIFQQVHSAIRYMHSMNIIHRDIKPNNIMFLDENHEHALLIDFGICGVSNGNEKEVIKAGTLDYLPPEIASGKEFVSNGKIDVWALGVVLYYMLYAKLPFEGKNDKEIITNILYNEPDYEYKGIDQKLSPSCLIILRKMLEKTQKFRCEINDESFSDWFNNEENEGGFDIHKAMTNPMSLFKSPTKKIKRKATVDSHVSFANNTNNKNVYITPYNYMKSLRGGGSP